MAKSRKAAGADPTAIAGAAPLFILASIARRSGGTATASARDTSTTTSPWQKFPESSRRAAHTGLAISKHRSEIPFEWRRHPSGAEPWTSVCMTKRSPTAVTPSKLRAS